MQAGDLAGAEAVVVDMRAAGAPPNAVTYTLLLDAHVRRGDLKVALPRGRPNSVKRR